MRITSVGDSMKTTVSVLIVAASLLFLATQQLQAKLPPNADNIRNSLYTSEYSLFVEEGFYEVAKKGKWRAVRNRITRPVSQVALASKSAIQKSKQAVRGLRFSQRAKTYFGSKHGQRVLNRLGVRSTSQLVRKIGLQPGAVSKAKRNARNEIVGAFLSVRYMGSPPKKAVLVLNTVRQQNGAPPRNYKGGSLWHNKLGILPAMTANGKKIRYREYDIKPYVPGKNRGTERLIIGSNGRVYYTPNHYKSFWEIK